MRPQLLVCHTAFGKDLRRIREYITTHAYDGVEWAWDGWRLMVPRKKGKGSGHLRSGNCLIFLEMVFNSSATRGE